MKEIKKVIVLVLVFGFMFSTVGFFAKPKQALAANGDYVWAKGLGGTGFDYGRSIVKDSSNNVYITGIFQSTTDFDPGAGTVNITPVASADVFILKLDSSGNYVWAKTIGGTGFDYTDGLNLDSSGNVYITGTFQNTVDFDPGAGTANLTSGGGDDVFILKLDSSGNYVWAKSVGGAAADNSYDIKVNSNNDVFISGAFTSTADFDPGAGTANLTSAGGQDAFILKLDSSGNYVWAKSVGAAGSDSGYSVVIDSTNNAYMTGWFTGTVDFDPGAGTVNLVSGGSNDIFALKLDSSGNYVWAKSVGAAGTDLGYNITLDSLNSVYITGYFQNTTDFDPGAGTANLTSAGSSDIFILKLVGATYTATYNANNATGGTIPTDPSSPYNNGSSVTVLGNTGSLVRTGYTFGGWNTAADGSGTTYAPAATFSINSDTTLYAKWTPNTFQVLFDGNVATTGSMSNQSFTYGVSQNLTTNAYSKNGYVFSGWNTAADGSGNSYSNSQSVSNLSSVNGAVVTLYAMWSVAPASAGGGGVVYCNSNTNTNCRSTSVTPATPVNNNIKTYNSPLDKQVKNCPAFTKYLKYGKKDNDKNEAKLWQAFLNDQMKEKLSVNGIYNKNTESAIKRFQNHYASEVLTPWGLKHPTGYTYKSTRVKANNIIGCPEGEVLLDNGVLIK